MENEQNHRRLTMEESKTATTNCNSKIQLQISAEELAGIQTGRVKSPKPYFLVSWLWWSFEAKTKEYLMDCISPSHRFISTTWSKSWVIGRPHDSRVWKVCWVVASKTLQPRIISYNINRQQWYRKNSVVQYNDLLRLICLWSSASAAWSPLKIWNLITLSEKDITPD